MTTAQHALARELFNRWVEDTDVAEQCGLTRNELLESVEFSISPRPPQFIIRGLIRRNKWLRANRWKGVFWLAFALTKQRSLVRTSKALGTSKQRYVYLLVG